MNSVEERDFHLLLLNQYSQLRIRRGVGGDVLGHVRALLRGFGAPGNTSVQNRGKTEIARRDAFAAPRRFACTAVRASVGRGPADVFDVRNNANDVFKLTMAVAVLLVPCATGCATMIAAGYAAAMLMLHVC